MEPPAKRMKLGQAPYDDDDDDEANLDELSMDPTQFDARQDPLYELDKGRAKAASRLKSAFERIFEKYERDFTDTGDEIDLETGEVIVNNGHLLSLEDEKDRNREGSISSDEEERIMRGKEVSSDNASHTKSSVQTTSSTHPPPGLPTGPSQQIMAYPHFSSPPNTFGFMDPFMGHGPADPLWQAPDLPMPLYQDRFGFIGQAMGYPPSFGYGYGPMLVPGGGFGHGSFGDFFHPQAPKKLPPAKAPARQLLPRVPSNADDSEEDDVLLSSNAEEVVKSVSIKSIKSLPSNMVAEKTKQGAPKDAKSVPAAGKEKEKDAKTSRRGRRKKAILPEKQPESNSGENEECGRSIESTDGSETLTQSGSITKSIDIPVLSTPPSSEEPVLKRKFGSEVVETEAPIEPPITVSNKVPTEGDVQSLGLQRRKSSRDRKQTEFYGQINWSKLRKVDTNVIGTQIVREHPIEIPINSLPLGTNESPEHAIPDESSHGENIEPNLGSPLEATGNKESVEETNTATSNQALSEVPPTNTGDPDGGEMEPSTQIHLHLTVKDSEQPVPLFSINGPGTDGVDISVEDKEMASSNEPRNPNNLSSEEPPAHPSEDIIQDTNPDQSGNQEVNVEDHSTEDATIRTNVEITPPDLADNEISAAIEESFQSNPISNNHRETPQSPTTQIQSEEAAAQLPEPAQEDLPPEPEIAESEIDEPDPTEPEMPRKSTPSRPSLTDDSDPLSVPDEDEPMLPPARFPTPQKSRIPGLFEKAELAFRPQVAQKDVRAKIIQSRSASPFKSSSPSKHRPSLSAKPNSTTPTPSTPKKKRRDSQTETNHTTASARKKYALTSLIPDDPDDDDDELSVLASSVAPSPFLTNYSHSTSKPHARFNTHPSPAATPRKTGRRHGFLMGATSTSSSRSALRTPHRISKRGAPPATDTRASRGPKLRFGGGSGSGVQSSPLARTVLNSNHREFLAATPSRRGRNGGGGRDGDERGRTRDRDEAGSVELGSSPVRTPGGTARRCGEDGFTCDRDFCFTCCK